MDEFDISVIIPVYNAEEYLEETITSALTQSLGLEFIQVILIDDGSTDGSAAICESFAKEFPENIVYIHQENAGVSAARNRGLDVATGRYIAFVDSDDMWSPKSFEIAVNFFCNHGDEVDLLSGRLTLFEGNSKAHPLDYKYKTKGKNSIIALGSNPCGIQSTIGNCFIKSEALKSIRFDPRFNTSEDTLFICEVLLSKCMYGISPKCKYLYRKRADGSSLSQRKTPEKHLQNLEVCKRLAEVSIEQKGCVMPFVQVTILYIINWLLFGAVDVPFSEDQAARWYDSMRELAELIDDDVLFKPKWFSREKRLFLLRLKYGDAFTEKATWLKRDSAYYNGFCIASLNVLSSFYVFEARRKADKLRFEGTTSVGELGDPFVIYAKDQKQKVYPAQIIPFPTKDFRSMPGDVIFSGQRFVLDIPLKPGQEYTFHVKMGSDSAQELDLTPHFSPYGSFDQRAHYDYVVLNDVMVKHNTRNLRMFKCTTKMHAATEYRRIKEILADRRFSKKTRRSYVRLRLRYHLYKMLHKKPVWLFADKEWKAGDNAENVYRYAMKESGYADAKMLFALQRTSSDYQAVSSYGHVIDPDSPKYKLLYLLASTIISSRAEQAMTNPFGSEVALVKDLITRDFVYLTHGTLFGDLSNMLNRPNKAIDLFCVSTNMEKKALLGSEYAYEEDRVKLTGMARYDGYRKSESARIVAFLPTWRADIAGKIIPGTSTREYVEDFCDTEYCKFYNALINDERLLSAMREYGYKGEFYVHPAFEKQAHDFIGNDCIMVGEGSADYERVLSESSLLVTDYSGVGFDFGYQRKPTVYCQYDSVFDEHHTYGTEVYFDYETEAFGPVAKSLDETVTLIVGYLERNCAIEDEYRDRADAMFGFSDYENCKRIFEEVLSFKKRMRDY